MAAAADALTRAHPVPAREVRYVRVERALFTEKNSPFWRAAGEGRVAVPLPDGTTLTAVIEGSLEHLHVDHEPDLRAWLAAQSQRR